MKKIRVSSLKKKGRVTRLMKDNFSDLANEANNKILCDKFPLKSIEGLHSILNILNEANEISKEMPNTHIFNKFKYEIEYLVKEIKTYLNNVK